MKLARDRTAHHPGAGDQDVRVETRRSTRGSIQAQARTAPARARISLIESSVQEAKKPPTTSRTSSSDSAPVQHGLVVGDVPVPGTHLGQVDRPQLHGAELVDLTEGGQDARPVGAQVAVLHRPRRTRP